MAAPSINASADYNAHLTTFVDGIPGPKGLIADQVLDKTIVPLKAGEYFRWDRGDATRIADDYRAPGSKPNKIEFNLDTAGIYTCKKRTKAFDILQDFVDNNQVPQARESLSIRTRKNVALGLEARAATALTTTSNYASTNYDTLAGVDQWDNASFSGNIEKDIDTMKEAIRIFNFGLDGEMFIIIPAAVAKVIKRDDKIRELIKYTQSNLLVNGDLPPTMFGLKVIIPRAAYTSSVKGAATTTIEDVWGKDVVVGMKTGADQIDEPSFIKLFVHKKYPNLEGVVRNWVTPNLDYTETVEYVTYNDVKITSNVGGYVLKSVIS